MKLTQYELALLPVCSIPNSGATTYILWSAFVMVMLPRKASV